MAWNEPTIVAGPFRFHQMGDDLWVAEDTQGGRYELTRQNYEGDDGTGDPALVDDWGVWDCTTNDWAHYPMETGYPTRSVALISFLTYWNRWQADKAVMKQL